MSDTDFDEAKFNELAAHLMDEDEDARYDAARQIQGMGKAVLEPALAWAKDTRPRMREMACFILGQLGYFLEGASLTRATCPAALPTLLDLLKNDLDEEVRASAAAALGHQQAVSTIPALIRAASDPSAEVRYDVAYALGSFGEWDWEGENAAYKPEVAAALLHLMDDEDEDVRDWATFGIHQGSHDTPETRARLWQALDDPNPDVRGEATEGLAKFGDRTLIPRLDMLLREDDDISPCYFLAAQMLDDPTLLPAVLAGAKRWEAGENTPHPCIDFAIKSLRKSKHKATLPTPQSENA